MQRVTISIDDDLSQAFDDMVSDQGYTSKSEAVRDLVRQAVESRRVATSADGGCVASLSYVYDHHVRALAQRLVDMQHDHHDIVVATMHIHLDHDSCLETVVLKGSLASVRRMADDIRAQRGVRFANLNIVSDQAYQAHDHGPDTHVHG